MAAATAADAQESTMARSDRWGRRGKLFDRYDVPITVSACAIALERNPAVVEWMNARGHDLLGHGLRWVDYTTMERSEEERGFAKQGKHAQE